MKKTVVGFIFILILHVPRSIDAAEKSIIINEVFANPSGPSDEANEFIELYNNGSEEIVLSEWTIEDTHGTVHTFTISNTTIAPGQLVSFRKDLTAITLNNAQDGVILKNALGELIDSMSFSETIEDKSWSRFPDGFGVFGETDVTEGNTNLPFPTLTPTRTPTDQPSPTLTKTPTPSKIPTPTKTPKPTKTPEREKTSTPITDILPTQELINDREESSHSAISSESAQNNILGVTQLVPDEVTPTSVKVRAAKDKPFISFWLITAGVFFVTSCGILLFRKVKYRNGF